MTQLARTPKRLYDSTNGRPVLTREEAQDTVSLIRRLTQDDLFSVGLEHNARLVINIDNNEVRNGVAGNELSLWFPSMMGSGIPITVGTNQMNEAGIREVVARAMTMKNSHDPVPDGPHDRDDWRDDEFKPRTPMPVSLWRQNTIEAMARPPIELVGHVIERLQSAKVVGAATIAMSACATYYDYHLGLKSWGEETDTEVTFTARLPDGTASGWGGVANRDWRALDLETPLNEAIQLAEQGRRPVAMEPGRWTVILSAAAVGQLVNAMSGAFDYMATERGATPFSDRTSLSQTKLGLRVMDERIRMVSDPADPDGGFLPFFTSGQQETAGLPFGAMTWIENGILKNLAYDTVLASLHRKPWAPAPPSLRVEAMPGVKTATVEEMIAQCERGLFINRLDYIEELDSVSGTLTGTTRDGCFFIKNGKIEHPTRNFRFMDAPILVLNKLLQIGAARRIAIGHLSQYDTGAWATTQWPSTQSTSRWPRLPIIAPPMMIQDFNLIALADAV